MQISRAFAFAVMLAALPLPALAQGLPPGVSSLSEVYGDWQVACTLVESEPRCAMSQTQLSNDGSRQRVLAVELTGADEAGTVTDTLAMPFGLKLDNGVGLAVDEQELFQAPFSTCLPAGCLVPLSFDANVIAQLSGGKTLGLKAVAFGTDQEVALSVSLNGLAPALARMGQINSN